MLHKDDHKMQLARLHVYVQIFKTQILRMVEILYFPDLYFQGSPSLWILADFVNIPYQTCRTCDTAVATTSRVLWITFDQAVYIDFDVAIYLCI